MRGLDRCLRFDVGFSIFIDQGEETYDFKT